MATTLLPKPAWTNSSSWAGLGVTSVGRGRTQIVTSMNLTETLDTGLEKRPLPRFISARDWSDWLENCLQKERNIYRTINEAELKNKNVNSLILHVWSLSSCSLQSYLFNFWLTWVGTGTGSCMEEAGGAGVVLRPLWAAAGSGNSWDLLNAANRDCAMVSTSFWKGKKRIHIKNVTYHIRIIYQYKNTVHCKINQVVTWNLDSQMLPYHLKLTDQKFNLIPPSVHNMFSHLKCSLTVPSLSLSWKNCPFLMSIWPLLT